MSQSVAPNPQADVDRLEAAADEAIAACAVVTCATHQGADRCE
jgi:hypothetical protein